MIRWILAGVLLGTSAHAADLTVLTAGAFRSVAADLIPAFETSSGDRVTLRNDTVGALVKRINAGEAFDVVLASPSALSELAKAGKIQSGSDVMLARIGVGMAVRQDAPKPDISSVDAFKSTMLKAHSVAFIDPASGGSSGIYIAQLFHTLGIAPAMASKSVLIKGGLAAEAVADGRAEIVLQQISEILAVPGVALVGPLPAEIQHETDYAGAVAATTSAPDAAKGFLAALSRPAAAPVLKARGMTPP